MKVSTDNYNPYGYSDEQLWALALSAITTEVNGDRHDVLRRENPEQAAAILRGWWGITTRAELDKAIHELMAGGGDRHGFNACLGWVRASTHQAVQERLDLLQQENFRAYVELTVVRHYQHSLTPATIFAFDVGRVVFLAREATTCELLSEQEAWRLIMEHAAQAREAYSDWKSYGFAYRVGIQYAMHDLGDVMAARGNLALRWLLTDPASPWLRHRPAFSSPTAAPAQA